MPVGWARLRPVSSSRRRSRYRTVLRCRCIWAAAAEVAPSSANHTRRVVRMLSHSASGRARTGPRIAFATFAAASGALASSTAIGTCS